MGAVQLKIDDLLLDTENPRIGIATNQRDALQKVLDDQGERLYELASSIVDEGMSPIDRLLVLKEKGGNRYISLEGNRRVSALKILANPTILNGLTLKPAMQKRFAQLAKQFEPKEVEPIDAYEVATRDDAATWLHLRHTGANQGRGVVDWSGLQAQRFRGSDPALQALEFVARYGNLSDHQKDLLGQRFPITTLDRLLSARHVRDAIGIAVKGGKLQSGLPAAELMKPLRKMVLDLAEEKINVSRLKNKDQQLEYLHTFDAESRPNLKKLDGARSVEDIPGTEFAGKATAKRATSKRTSGASDPSERKTLVPKGVKINIQDNKTAEIFKELRYLKLEESPHAIAVLLRVFLELSVDAYLERNGISKTKKLPKDNRVVDKKLTEKLNEVVAHLAGKGVDKRDFIGIERALKVPHSPLNIDLLHGYVHNQFVTPKRRDLTDAWTESQRFFEKVWP
jgi:hypothetical protein